MSNELTLIESFTTTPERFDTAYQKVLLPLRRKVKDAGGTTRLVRQGARYQLTVCADATTATPAATHDEPADPTDNDAP